MFENWSTKKKLGLGVVVFFVILLIGGALAPSEEEGESTAPTESAEPAEFELNWFEIRPEEVQPESDIVFRANIVNTGEQEGTIEIEMEIDGEIMETENLTLKGGENSFFSALIPVGQKTGNFDGSINFADISETKSFTIKTYPATAPETYEVRTAGRALAEFLMGTKNEDLEKMADYTQKTWKSEKENVQLALEDFIIFDDLKGFEIHELDKNTEWNYKAEVTLYWRKGPPQNPESIKEISTEVNIICEEAPYEPNPEGDWGVNPLSLFWSNVEEVEE